MSIQLFALIINGFITILLFVLAGYINSILRRIAKLERQSVSEPLCVQRHLLDEERIRNLMLMATKTESQNNSDHGELKDTIGNIYLTLETVKDCVHRLARDIEKRKGIVVNEKQD